MANSALLKKEIENHAYDSHFEEIYIDKHYSALQKDRYIALIRQFEEKFSPACIRLFSAPGRTEIGGNHTDHQHGEVLAASVNIDTIAAVERTDDNRIEIISGDHPAFTLDASDTSLHEEEKETSTALVRGVLAKLGDMGYEVGGFRACMTSDVLVGSGLSSSASFETLIGTIESGLYNDGRISPVEIAFAGQYAENVFFGKPSGLMDQMACSVGSLVHINFADIQNPVIEKIDCNPNDYGYSLCITDTKGSHADLTDEYAAIPNEMKAAAKVCGKDVLCGVSAEDLLAHLGEIREKSGDRAALRAFHFVSENARVGREAAALKQGDFDSFLHIVKESGDSSFKYLQNIYSNRNVHEQNVSLALAVSDVLLGDDGVSRVHGGGFAGTIQAFVKNSAIDRYQHGLDAVFGEGACHILKIRGAGGIEVTKDTR